MVVGGVEVNGAESLAQALAERPDFVNCYARYLYRYATGGEHADERCAADTTEAYAAGETPTLRELFEGVALQMAAGVPE